VARAARLLGIRAVVVMPDNAPEVKVAGVRADEAEIVFVGPHNEERVARAHEIADQDGLILIPSANHPAVMAGQGTIGLEIHEQLREIGVDDLPVVVIVPVGLGGLAAGVSAALAELRPAARVFGAEPALAADTQDSLAAGVRTAWPAEQTARTIADGLRGEMPAELAFELLRRHLAGVVTVEESEIIAAMKVAAREARLVLEPSGAVPLSALLFHRRELSSQAPVVVVASGGNVDPQRYVEWLGTAD
jgi:threonine dehydratase